MKKYIFTLLVLAAGITSVAHAQNKRQWDHGHDDSLEQRVRTLEQNMSSVMWRLNQLEQNGGTNAPHDWYCIAQCQGNSSTAAGGSGKSQAEAKQAAYNEVRKQWTCQMEITECSQEK